MLTHIKNPSNYNWYEIIISNSYHTFPVKPPQHQISPPYLFHNSSQNIFSLFTWTVTPAGRLRVLFPSRRGSYFARRSFFTPARSKSIGRMPSGKLRQQVNQSINISINFISPTRAYYYYY